MIDTGLMLRSVAVASGLMFGISCTTAISSRTQTSDSVQDVAVRNATIVNPTAETPWSNMTILVHGDRIVAVGDIDDVDIPDGALVLDGRDLVVIPGLWDAHTHMSYPGECSLPMLLASGIYVGPRPRRASVRRKQVAR